MPIQEHFTCAGPEMLRAKRYLYTLIQANGPEPVVKNFDFDRLACPLDYSHTGTHCIQEYFCKFRDHICRPTPTKKVRQRAVWKPTVLYAHRYPQLSFCDAQRAEWAESELLMQCIAYFILLLISQVEIIQVTCLEVTVSS